MNRRELLHRASALAAVAGVAGCLGSAGSDSPPTDREPTTDSGATTDDARGRFSGVRSDHDDPFRTISVGSREEVAFPDNNQPRGVRVWNAADESREISVRVARSAEILVDRTLDFEADAYLELVLNEPADYALSVGLADGDATTVDISRTSFDCNQTGTDAGVMPDGRVETMSMSTAMACHGPEVADAALSVGRRSCGTEHRATVGFEGERVRMDGAVRTPTPQSDLSLAGTDYDRTADALTVRVRASETDDGDPGTQCVGEVTYEATVDFEYALPDEVAVVHESMDETLEVTRADRGGD
ncbi:hypothetical protein [Halorussus salinisoli]|uniref:hypothetical protein n=1 Tax=Halorussus salinisoli TaxID=2558242 RepID=UPI0010C200CE|nr:hypothetical protein [Halorussus salinisoli]